MEQKFPFVTEQIQKTNNQDRWGWGVFHLPKTTENSNFQDLPFHQLQASQISPHSEKRRRDDRLFFPGILTRSPFLVRLAQLLRLQQRLCRCINHLEVQVATISSFFCIYILMSAGHSPVDSCHKFIFKGVIC